MECQYYIEILLMAALTGTWLVTINLSVSSTCLFFVNRGENIAENMYTHVYHNTDSLCNSSIGLRFTILSKYLLRTLPRCAYVEKLCKFWVKKQNKTQTGIPAFSLLGILPWS